MLYCIRTKIGGGSTMEEEKLTWLQKLSNAITDRFGDGIGGVAMKIVAALIILVVGLLIVKLIIKLVRKSKWYKNKLQYYSTI